jgi:hypothetical protein
MGTSLGIMRRRISLLMMMVIALVACGSDGVGSSEISSPCDLADAAMVQSAFGGTVAEGVEGEARNCDFVIEGGPVFAVDVFYYGSADGWDSTRQGYEDNRGGVTDVAGIGDAAFFPGDAGASELVVQSGGEIFSVTVFAGFDEPGVEVINGVADLSKAIADNLA